MILTYSLSRKLGSDHATDSRSQITRSIEVTEKNGPKGGIAIAIKANIKHDPLIVENLDLLEIIGVQITMNETNPIKIYSAYYPPTKNFTQKD